MIIIYFYFISFIFPLINDFNFNLLPATSDYIYFYSV